VLAPSGGAGGFGASWFTFACMTVASARPVLVMNV
jgi:hypothetical protein